MSVLAERLGRSEAVRTARAALAGDRAWVVGGTVRDALLDRAKPELDLVVQGEAGPAARRLAAAGDAHVFPLSERFGAWRVIARDRTWQADVTPARGTIEEDLSLRDFTINAMATSLAGLAGPIDPCGGAQDLDRRLLRAVGPRSFADDPLRVLRMARFACELAFEVDEQTKRAARSEANRITAVAAERCWAELRRLIASDDPVRGIRIADDAGLTGPLLPELERLKGVEQNPYHHLDVWGHTLEVVERLVELQRDPAQVFGETGAELSVELDRPFSDELTRGHALRLGALLHDVGKPATRAVTDDGRILFWGHDGVGAELARSFSRRLHTSTGVADFVAAIAQHHLRLGFLVHERPLSRRHVYRYMRACEPVEVEVTVLSVADRLATMGPRTKDKAVERHVGLARELAAEAIAWRRTGRPQPPVRGDELMSALGLEPGPQVGRLLDTIAEATFAGEVRSRADALALARQVVGAA